MLFTKIFNTSLHHKIIFNPRFYSNKSNPFKRTWNLISNELKLTNKSSILYPEHADVVIIGGGFIGTSVGYWLKTKAGAGLSVVILEKDLTYSGIQTNYSLGSLTQHFSLAENILLSQYSVDFFRNIKANLNKDVDIKFFPNGYLVLASDKYADQLEQNVALQKEHGVKNELLTSADINKKYPWINTTDIKLGCIGTECEGLFNPWALLKGLLFKCHELGTTIVKAEVIGFEMEQQRDVLMEGVAPGSFRRINKVVYKTDDNEEHSIKFAACILAAGDNSGEIAKLAQIGVEDGLLKVPLPVERREFNIYSIDDENIKASINTPCIMDTSGLWLRRNGLENNFLCGHTPLVNNDVKELLTDEYYTNIIQPSLLNRYNFSKENQVKRLHTEAYDCNIYDDTGILGCHPYHSNLIIAAGFGKLGCHHAPGIGRGVAELIIDGRYCSIDLTRFGFDRLLVNEPLVELNMY